MHTFQMFILMHFSQVEHTTVKSTWIKKLNLWSSHHGSAETNLTSIQEDTGLIPGLAQSVKAPALL